MNKTMKQENPNSTAASIGTSQSAPSVSHEATAGLAAGILGTIIGYPLDRVKTQFQLNTAQRPTVLQALQSLVRQGGIYKGVGPPLVSLSILNSLTFPTYSTINRKLDAHPGWDWRHGMAAISVGPVSATISTVENLVKTQVQTHRYTNSWKCVQEIIKSRQLSLFYTGHLINTARESTFLLTYFSLYEGFRYDFVHTAGLAPAWAVPLAGGLSGAAAWFVSFPLDCVRAGVQAQPIDPATNARTMPTGRSWQVLRSLIESKGVLGLYHGVTPSLLRAFLVSGSRFTAYETTLWLLGEHRY